MLDIVNEIALLAVMMVGEEGKLVKVRVLFRPGVRVKEAKLELLIEGEAISEGRMITMVS
jgi:hypothetical protein